MYKLILAALDDSANAQLALEQAIKQAKLCDARLHLLHVVNLFDLASADVGMPDPTGLRNQAKTYSEKVLANARATAQAAGIETSSNTRSCWGGGSEVAEQIVEEANELMEDLIVMGTHGRGGMLHLMLGSVAEAVMRHTYSPLLIIRNPEQQPGKAPMLQ